MIMPPASFMGVALSSPFPTSYVFTVPPRTQVGDSLVAFVATDASATGLTIPTGWTTTFLGAAADGSKIRIVRKTYAASDGPTITMTPTGSPFSGVGHGALLAYRQLNEAAAIVATATALVTTTATVAYPTVATTKYSDLWFGAYYCNDEGMDTSMVPAGSVGRVALGGDGYTLVVAELLPESVGAVAGKTAAIGFSVSGVAVSVILAGTDPSPPAVLNSAVSGAIGFTDIGV